MKRILPLLLLFTPLFSIAQQPNFDWAEKPILNPTHHSFISTMMEVWRR
ncbi:hypothetical protein OAW23_09120 [Flavobacteriales bacterium]|nr:hypothetical protein [Flavobacteriales bacterium]